MSHENLMNRLTGWLIGLQVVLCVCPLLCGQTLFLPYDATDLTDEQKALNPDYIAYPSSLKDQIPPAGCTPEVEQLGPFSVAPGRQVFFSPGNLQYNAAAGTHQCADGTTQPGTWRFAEHQWDYIGSDNKNISASYDGWIDLFGWGTSGWNSGANAYQPYSTSSTNVDYTPGGNADNDLTGAYAYADWGVYNQINSDAPGTWRTLTNDEWVYLFHERPNAENLFALGSVNGINGAIILPDNWVTPAGVSFVPSTSNGLTWKGTYYENYNDDNFSHNIYTAAQWSIMEKAGATFLPAAGFRYGTEMFYADFRGYYTSTTHYSLNYPDIMSFSLYNIRLPNIIRYRYGGFSVRLVKAVPSPPKFSVSPVAQVEFAPGNLQYNAAEGTHQCADGTTQPGTWRFAEHQWDFIGDANTNISASYNGWIDLFGWGTSGWNSGANAYQPYVTNTITTDYAPVGGAKITLQEPLPMLIGACITR